MDDITEFTVTDSCSKSEAFNSYFRSIFTSEDSFSMLHTEGSPFPDMPSTSISIMMYYMMHNMDFVLTEVVILS